MTRFQCRAGLLLNWRTGDTRTADVPDPEEVCAEGRRVEARTVDVLPLDPRSSRRLLLDDTMGRDGEPGGGFCVCSLRTAKEVSFANSLFPGLPLSLVSTFMVFFTWPA